MPENYMCPPLGRVGECDLEKQLVQLIVSPPPKETLFLCRQTSWAAQSKKPMDPMSSHEVDHMESHPFRMFFTAFPMMSRVPCSSGHEKLAPW